MMRTLGFDPGEKYEVPAERTAESTWADEVAMYFRRYGLITILGLVGLAIVMGSGRRR